MVSIKSATRISSEADIINIIGTKLSPEEKLLREILLRAWRDLQDQSEQRISREAYQWFISSDIKPFSCRWLLDKLGWDQQWDIMIANVKSFYTGVEVKNSRIQYKEVASLYGVYSQKGNPRRPTLT